MNNQIEQADQNGETPDDGSKGYDYTHVSAVARIALYDDLRSAPRVTEILPAPTHEFIENLASKVYEQAKMSGGTIPYTVIREVSENFIHARFAEVTVSILDDGNTIRFADQGPGIPHKEKAQLPGFTSAVEPMKHYIRGVGSGLPIVKEYLDFSHGTITIEDNLGTGSVVTISLRQDAPSGRDMTPAPYGSDPYPQPVQPYTAPQNAPYGAPSQPYPYQTAPNPYAAAPQPGYPPQGMPPTYPGTLQQGYPIAQQHSFASLVPPLSQRERDFLPIFLNEGALGVTDLSRITGVPQSSTYVTLTKLEQAGLIEKTVGQKRILTELGYQVANSL